MTPSDPTHVRESDTDRPAAGFGRTEEGTSPPAATQVPAQRAGGSPTRAAEPSGQPGGRPTRRWRMRRRSGAPVAIVLVLAGLWVASVPYFGPYLGFGYDASPLVDDPVLTPDRLWLTALPALVIVVGGLVLGLSRNRVTAAIGAVSAMNGGAWLVIGPVVSQLWGAAGPGNEIGVPLGGVALRVVDQLVVFYGVGVVVVVLAAFALGRDSRPSRD